LFFGVWKNLLRSIAKQIWKSYGEDDILTIRAKHLWDLCSDIIGNLHATLYLDIGTGTSHNALAFSSIAKETVGIDLTIPANNILKSAQGVHIISGDGTKLPLNRMTFDVVSLFSVIEYVPDPQQLLKEVFRVAKPNSIVIIQMPNRFFPIDPHNGVPFIFLLPKWLRNYVLNALLFEGTNYRETPTLKKVLVAIQSIEPQTQIAIKKIRYPSSIILPQLRKIYGLLTKIGLLDLIPIGYIVVLKREAQSTGLVSNLK
jgi:ubiquinone/menaquinone biosynthesis C-methylase UbiE